MDAIRLSSEITVRLVQSMGGDHMVVAAARVSTSGEDALVWADPEKVEESAGLIRYLMRHRHGTPFEHSALTFFVHAPIFVWREWHRHRVGMSYNEESGRYKQLEPVFWVPRRERPLLRGAGYRASRPTFQPLPDGAPGDAEHAALLAASQDVCALAYRHYQAEIERGIAPEVARRLLPLSTYSSCWVTCNPRALMHFLSLRTHDTEARFVSYPQAEIEEAARAAEEIFSQGWPLTYRAFLDSGRVGP